MIELFSFEFVQVPLERIAQLQFSLQRTDPWRRGHADLESGHI